MPLDIRRNAYRPDLADEALRGRVQAARFVAPTLHQIVAASAPVRDRPDASASWTTEALFGETVNVFETRDGWAWGQLTADGYVGYMPLALLRPQVQPPTHRVAALGTFLYPAPDMKTPPSLALSLTARLAVDEIGATFARLACGRYVPRQHIAELAAPAQDVVATARRFLGVPYQWGGKTRAGLDCSGLVQVALDACGITAPRDSDMQAGELGVAIAVAPDLPDTQAGDFIFWKGHVGIVAGPDALLHANAYHMAVVEEPLRAAVGRIAASGSPVTGHRRLSV